MPAPLSTDRAFTEDDLRQMVLRLAHEIRNPLATIKSAVQLLEHLQRPEGQVAEFYDSIQVEVARIDRVVRDMQVFVRLDPQTARQAALAEVVAAAVESQEAAARARSTRIDNAGGPAVSVLVDCAQLETAVGELIGNAVRFSPVGSVVLVRWRAMEPSQVVVEVEDQGPGIAPELDERIMRPFFSTSTHGTGLGLNIVARTAAIASGRLSWTNLEQGGARFSLLLPRL